MSEFVIPVVILLVAPHGARNSVEAGWMSSLCPVNWLILLLKAVRDILANGSLEVSKIIALWPWIVWP